MKKIIGKVMSGDKKGRRLGFPTANISLEEKIESGVYSGNVIFEGKRYKAAIFIDQQGKRLEAYILDFSGNLYDKQIEVAIGKKIREVKKFESEKSLAEQIRKDVEKIRESEK